jgi:branched-chain amino acid transport system permease protein
VLINPFVGRPDHEQFILLVGVGLIIVNGLLMVFGPTPIGQSSLRLRQLRDRPAAGDKARVYAAGAAVVLAAALF